MIAQLIVTVAFFAVVISAFLGLAFLADELERRDD